MEQASISRWVWSSNIYHIVHNCLITEITVLYLFDFLGLEGSYNSPAPSVYRRKLRNGQVFHLGGKSSQSRRCRRHDADSQVNFPNIFVLVTSETTANRHALDTKRTSISLWKTLHSTYWRILQATEWFLQGHQDQSETKGRYWRPTRNDCGLFLYCFVPKKTGFIFLIEEHSARFSPSCIGIRDGGQAIPYRTPESL